jgi:RNA polymerase sigma factor (sigma-70 family)
VKEAGPQGISLEEMAARVRAGDPAAEEYVVRTFERPVRAYVLMATGDPQLADEMVQEVLWNVVCALREGRVQQPAVLGAFVRGTARNMVSGHIREQARRKLSPIPEDLPGSAAEHEAFERNHAARQAIATLEKHEREVLMLSLIEGLVPDEIARRLGVTPEVVRQRKSRALRRLGETLRPPSQTPPARLLKK